MAIVAVTEFQAEFGGMLDPQKRFGFNHPRRDRDSQSGAGEIARQTFSRTGEEAPGYRVLPDHFQTASRMPAPDWAQKSFVAELHAEGARSTMGKRNWEMHESQKFWLGYDVTSVRPSVRTYAPPCKPM